MLSPFTLRRSLFTSSPIHEQPIIQWLFLSVVIGAIVCLTPFAIIDDAYISFRHAHNLSTTGQLVFNPGEHVEGVTNLLWSLGLAGNDALRLLPPERFAVIVSILCLVWAAFRILQLGRLLEAPFYAGLAACGLLFLTPDFLLATSNGLEGGLFTALVLEMIWQYYRNHVVRAYAVAGLLFLTRPESLALGVLLTVVLYREHRSWRKLQVGLGLLGGIVFSTTLWRLIYYHSPLPNSLIAKSMSIPAWLSPLGLIRLKLSLAYMLKVGFVNWHYVVVLGLGLASFRRTRRSRTHSDGLLALCIGILLFSILIMVGNGGDWMPHGRLFMYYGTLYAVVLLVLMARRAIPIFLCVVLLGCGLLQTTMEAVQASPEFRLHINPGPDTFDGSVSPRLRDGLEPGDILSAEAIGYISYRFPRNYVHDPAGLTDRHIARYGRPSHRFGKCDPAYTLGVVRPAVAVWHYGAHLKGVDQDILDQYETFCAKDCGTESADIVMVRLDRALALAPLFADWQPVRPTSDGTEEPLAEHMGSR